MLAPLPKLAYRRKYGFALNKTPQTVKVRLIYFKRKWFVIKRICGKWYELYSAAEKEDAVNYYCQKMKLN